MEWLPTWEQLATILILVITVSKVVEIFSNIGRGKRKTIEENSHALIDIQSNLARILESIAKIEGKMDTSSTQIIDLERKHALTDQRLTAAWGLIDEIKENCKEIQREKRKEQLG